MIAHDKLPHPLEALPGLVETALPSAQFHLLRTIGDYAWQKQVALYLVGGLPRDLLLDHPSPDLDLVVAGNAPALAAQLTEQYGGSYQKHERFGTAKWISPSDIALDLISARKESYSRPGALPTVEAGSIYNDLQRRDFSINTIAMRLDGPHYGETLDPLNGYSDLQAGIVRVLHPRSFMDDPTRILRAARFSARFDFPLEQTTATQMQAALPCLAAVSGKRLCHELDLILEEADPAPALSLLEEWNALAAIHPSLHFQASQNPSWQAASLRNLQLPQRYALWLMDLDQTARMQIIQRLVLDKPTQKIIQDAAELRKNAASLAAARCSERTFYLDGIALPAIRLMQSIDAGRAQEKFWKAYLEKDRTIQAISNGETLKALGLKPGPRYQQILTTLRAAWLDGELHTAQEEEALLHKLLAADR
jgi:tRNA nucleotidyltransferase (CCA-adding enzyme)